MKNLILLILALLTVGCSQEKPHTPTLFQKHELPFSNFLKNTTQLNIFNYLYFYNGAGTAIADFNNDGLNDIFLTSNLGENTLLLNKGDLSFKKVTAFAKAPTAFTTGVTTVDINNDGLLDIYISNASEHLYLQGSNQLWVNQGVKNGVPVFIEEAAKFNLNQSGLFTQAAFFDFDLDGDLDVYLLKHSVHPNSNYNKGAVRYVNDPKNGDFLLENKNGTYIDVSEKAGIIQTKISYGLGISTSDINNDGYPDIYIGNDFFENDYLYLNQKDGTFKEVNTTTNSLQHTTHFSMGNEIVDLNNDGLSDIISVDMLPENLETLKAAGTEYTYPIYQNQLKAGYQPQFMQNTLHFNQGNTQFSETAFQSGIAATEWSWSPLAADFDLDGHKDLFISNGIKGATNDMDFINFISNDAIQKRLGIGMLDEDLTLIEQLPKKRTANYIYKNNGDRTFSDLSKEWLPNELTLSNGAAYGDLDNDGDLDIVINNVDAPAQLLENKTIQKDSSSYLKIRFLGPQENSQGIGAKVIFYQKGTQQTFENYTTRGYLSAVPPEILVGLNKVVTLDSLQVIWPDQKSRLLTNLTSNTTVTLDYQKAKRSYVYTPPSETSYIENTNIPFSFTHKDGISLEFSRDPLVPYATTNEGPHIATGDMNNDGKDDVIALGGKRQPSVIFLQSEDGDFQKMDIPKSNDVAISEDVYTTIFDANGDGNNDLLIASGGNEFTKGNPLQPRLYQYDNGELRFRESAFKDTFINASKATPVDLDNDGDLDLSIVANASPREFGKTPSQFLFENDGQGNFNNITETYAPDFQEVGNVYDIQWKDIDGNGYPDAIMAGHWMPITIFLNDGNKLLKQNNNLSKTNGWWNTLQVADFDKDGDLDILAGNWGLNTRLQATHEQPITLYLSDFDDNGKIDPVVTYYYQDKETTIATKDELVKQLPYINKEFLEYNAFAKANISQIFPKNKLKAAQKKHVFLLASMYFENTGNGNFKSHLLPFEVQSSSVHTMFIDDFNGDTYPDALLAGNKYDISTQLGRLDASKGILLLNDQKGNFTVAKDQNFNISGAARSIEKLEINGKTHYIVGINNDTPIVLKKAEE